MKELDFDLLGGAGGNLLQALEDAGLVIREVDIDEHHVIITGDAGTSIVRKGGGVSWSWLSDKRGKDGMYHSVGPSAKKLKSWTPEQIEAWGRKAIKKMHKQGGKMGCLICDPEALGRMMSQFTLAAPAKKRANKAKK